MQHRVPDSQLSKSSQEPRAREEKEAGDETGGDEQEETDKQCGDQVDEKEGKVTGNYFVTYLDSGGWDLGGGRRLWKMC